MRYSTILLACIRTNNTSTEKGIVAFATNENNNVINGISVGMRVRYCFCHQDNSHVRTNKEHVCLSPSKMKCNWQHLVNDFDKYSWQHMRCIIHVVQSQSPSELKISWFSTASVAITVCSLQLIFQNMDGTNGQNS
jgi:hypothetical protein